MSGDILHQSKKAAERAEVRIRQAEYAVKEVCRILVKYDKYKTSLLKDLHPNGELDENIGIEPVI